MAFEMSRLAGDPEGFFGLPPGFSERDLQRAYHASIRKFRPDYYPREFQRIREARDRLRDQVRWRAGRTGAGVEPQSPHPPQASEGPELLFVTPDERSATYRRLASSPAVARDYATLALLSETVQSPGREFTSWLLEGLGRFPDDEGLEALLRCYVQEDLPLREVERFLRAASRTLPRRSLWTVPSAAWETAAMALPFDRFRSLWEDCEDAGELSDEPARAWLLARVLPALVARGDPDWIRERIEWLSARHDQISEGAGVLDALEDWEAMRAAMEAGDRPLGRHETRSRRWRRFLGRVEGPARFPSGEGAELARDLVEALLLSGMQGGAERLRAAARAVVEREKAILRDFDPRDPELVSSLRFLHRAAALLARDVPPALEPSEDEVEEASLVWAIHLRSAAAQSWTVRGLSVVLRIASVVYRAVDILSIALFAFLVCASLMGTVFVLRRMSTVYEWIRWTVGIGIFGLVWWGVAWTRRHWVHVGKWAMERALEVWERYAYRSSARMVAVQSIRDLGIAPESMVDDSIMYGRPMDGALARGVVEDPALRVLWVAYRFAA
jgi:hypothetical protein